MKKNLYSWVLPSIFLIALFYSPIEMSAKTSDSLKNKNMLSIEGGFPLYKSYFNIRSCMFTALQYRRMLPLNFFVSGGYRFQYLDAPYSHRGGPMDIFLTNDWNTHQLFLGVGYYLKFTDYLGISLGANMGYAALTYQANNFEDPIPILNLPAIHKDVFNYNFSLKLEANIKYIKIYAAWDYNAVAYTLPRGIDLPPNSDPSSILLGGIMNAYEDFNTWNFSIGIAYIF